MKESFSINLNRYKKFIISWLAFIIFYSFMLFFNSILQGSYSIYAVLTQNFWLDTSILFLTIPVFSIIAFIIGGYLFTPLLLFLRKKVLGSHLVYGIRDPNKPKIFKRAFINSIYSSLLAFNLGILLSDQSNIHGTIFNSSFQTTPFVIRQILTLVILFPLISFIGIAVFSA
ncbi:MAG: hypothetical protein EU550_01705, partial [Promethearchaeota archaeon]